MAINTEVWVRDIQDVLFKNNAFMKRLTDHSEYINNLTVHIPQAGANPGVSKNRTNLPGTIAQRTDTDLNYTMNYYTSDPVLLTDIDSFQISYNKRMSILGGIVGKTEEVIGNQTCYAMAPTTASTITRVIRTTGTLSTGALSSGATGSRSAVTLSDIARLKGILDNDNVPATGRVLLVSSDIYNSQLLAIQDIYQAQSYGSSALPDGVISRVHGFDIICRPTVVSYSTGATNPALKTVGDEGAVSSSNTTDNLGILAFHPAFVSNALGSVKVFIQENLPNYYGSLFSTGVLHGAAKLRTDQIGIAALVQQ